MSLENGLANQFLDIPPATASILSDLARKGVILGLTSRHSVEWMKSFLADKRYDGVFSFLIGSNGAQYYSDQTKKALSLCTVTMDQVLKTASSLENLPVNCGVVHQNELIFDKPGVYGLFYALMDGKRMKSSGLKDLDSSLEFPKILICGSKALIRKIRSGFTIPGLRLLQPSPALLEAVPQNCSIFQALGLAFEEFGVDAAHTMYFGQSDKDIEALLHTYGIAMKDSSPKINAVSRRITKYNAAQNGIGYMLNILRMDKTCSFRAPKEAGPHTPPEKTEFSARPAPEPSADSEAFFQSRDPGSSSAVSL